MSWKVYEYKNCSTCRKAVKFLDQAGVDYKPVPIRETPPTKTELKAMLKLLDGDIKKLFNTSGQDYRRLGLKDKLPNMTPDEALDLLASNGNLVKRPFVLSSDKKRGMVGFREEIWQETFS